MRKQFWNLYTHSRKDITQACTLNGTQEQILEMGSNQFLVDLTNAKTIALKIIEGPNLGETFVQTAAKGKSNLGRKNTN